LIPYKLRPLSFPLTTPFIGALPKTATAIVRITDDPDGNIGAYWSRYMSIRGSGDRIVSRTREAHS